MLSLCHMVNYNPMDDKYMNFLEILNDIFVLITS